MAIVKMQRLHLLAMEEERQSLMDALLQFGRCAVHWQTGFCKTGISWMACRDFIKKTVSGRLQAPPIPPAL